MPKYSDDQIREYAHRLWEEAESPVGRSDDFWHQAKSELEADVPGDEDSKPPTE